MADKDRTVTFMACSELLDEHLNEVGLQSALARLGFQYLGAELGGRPYAIWRRDLDEILVPLDPLRGDYTRLLEEARNKALRVIAPTVLPDLVAALTDARKVLLFADGNCVANTDFALADLYAEDCEWAQDALSGAGCHPRGKIPDLRREDDPGDWYPCLNGCTTNVEHFFAHRSESV